MEITTNLTNSQNRKRAIGLIHKIYLSSLKNSRKYTASTKTRSEVRGGGRKPWKQKGTGQARAGSINSPLWKGGGVIFGPQPKTVTKKINKKEKKLAILSALYLKKNKTKILKNELFENLNNSSNSKTKAFLNFFKNLNLKQDIKILIILPELTKEFKLGTQNLKNIEIASATCLNVAQLLNSTIIIVSDQSLLLINKTYGKA